MFTRFYALLRAFTRFYALLSQLSSLTCLRAFISVKQFSSLLRLQFTPLTIKGYTVFRVPRVTRLPILSTRCQGYTILKNASPGCQSFQRAFRVTNFKKRVELDGITNAERAFVFKLFLCNPFARSAGIFYALLSQLSSLTCLRAFTRFYALLSQLSSLAVYSVYSLLR